MSQKLSECGAQAVVRHFNIDQVAFLVPELCSYEVERLWNRVDELWNRAGLQDSISANPLDAIVRFQGGHDVRHVVWECLVGRRDLVELFQKAGGRGRSLSFEDSTDKP